MNKNVCFKLTVHIYELWFVLLNTNCSIAKLFSKWPPWSLAKSESLFKKRCGLVSHILGSDNTILERKNYKNISSAMRSFVIAIGMI